MASIYQLRKSDLSVFRLYKNNAKYINQTPFDHGPTATATVESVLTPLGVVIAISAGGAIHSLDDEPEENVV
ncbi:MAG: hypothetical protein EKK46_10725 [Rhodocyclaceae bacterium]|nr:MAG: hypothetical protein EKK46_10725 [Rhodocyclaceae bacterium]